jgi:plastocyanin
VKRALTGIMAMAVALGMFAVGCGDDDDGGPTGPGGVANVTITVVPNAMNLQGNAYSPDTATVSVGQTVRWVNSDAMVHTATADGGSFNTGNIGANGGASAIVTITGATGVRQYHCSVSGHDMQGWINVIP